jgi:SMC interacting uncharacterized protein involved in chromosome segregation
MADSEDDDFDIYINNQEDNIEDELYTYLHEIRADKKVSISLLLNILRTTKDFLIIFLYLDTNLYID